MEGTAKSAAAPDGAYRQATPCTEKKPNLWYMGLVSCISSVLSFFGKPDLMNDYDETFYIKSERIVESQCIGEGAQGRVHLATLKFKNAPPQTVAIKYVQQIDDMMARHLRKITHENIVQTIGVCINPPKYYIIMEYCEFGSLFDYMRSGPQFSSQQMVLWARAIACGMAHLHENKIVHRDLKSPNVLINAKLIAKVSDFGTCRTIDGRSAKMSFTGTVNWMAPEVIRGENYTELVDVWSYGVVIWEMVTLQFPYYKMEQHAIMWGVGTACVTLPIPMDIPYSIQSLLRFCWQRRYTNRPCFKIIIQILDVIASEMSCCDHVTFLERQGEWALEARASLEKAYLRSEDQCKKKIPVYTQLDLYNRRDLKDKRHILNLRLDATNDMFYEACSILLELETRERNLAQKEKMVDLCSCGLRRLFMFNPQFVTSSSDGVPMHQGYCALLQKTDTKLLVKMVKDKTVTTAFDEVNPDDAKIKQKKIRSDNIESRKETLIALDGKMGVKPVLGHKKIQTGINDIAEV